MASGGRRRKSRGGARPKAKKRTKYLRLSRIIVKAEVDTPPRSPEEDDDGPAPSPSPSPPTASEVKKEDDGGQQQQAEPFAVHHEASTLFAAFPAPSLSDILGASASIAGGGSDESTPSPSSSPGTAGLPGAEEEDLARRALRGRERWVYCRSSSSSPPPTTTATATATSSASPCSSAASTGASARSLLLKLDYADVMAAWADRGPLYIGDGHAAPKPKPGPELDNVSPFLLKAPPSPWGRKRSVRAVLGGVRGGDTDGGSSPSVPVFVEVEPPPHAAACAWRSAPQETVESERAERVRRYKEKRLNRLFAKRIRYEVRRVNAVKRPRFKGRFIKEHEEIEVELT